MKENRNQQRSLSSYEYEHHRKADRSVALSITGVPNLGYICLSEGVHLRLAIEGKIIFTCCLFSNICTYIT